MKLQVQSFRGEAPRVTPRGLPENAAQAAVNCRMQTGDLESWRQFVPEQALANTGPVQTIYKLNGAWLSWDHQVDVARPLIPGDTTYRVYLTCPDLYTTPRWTNYAMATTGSAPFPVETRPLGVPGPDTAPTLAVGADPTPSSFSIDIEDAGNELATSWTYTPTVDNGTNGSSVRQRNDVGNPAPCYELEWQDWGDSGGLGTWQKRNFGIQNCNVCAMEFDVWLNDAGGISRVFAGLQRSETGKGISVGIQHNPDLGGTGWVIQIGTYTTWYQGQYQSTVAQSPTFSGFAVNTWFRARVEAVKNATDGTTAVTFTITDPSDDSELVTLTATLTLDDDAVGGWCGFTSGDDQRGTPGTARIDNIRVTGTGSTGYVATNVATNYLFIYENDLLEPSAPSPVTADVLRPDGVAVTVTTPTTVPPEYADYQITTKAIFRAVTGDGGTVYKFVTRIPLAQADFVDNIRDEDTGPAVLISEEFDLPPDDLEGIIPLPNNCMAGFRKNQLCFSAEGYPHAWPVRYRKTIDTDIVAIANIDTTVVVGSKSFVYTATGSSPDAYSMSQPGEKQACLSKLGMIYVPKAGVAFPSPDGYQLCQGSAGAVQNLTEAIFTKRQWEALKPFSIIAAVHDDVLHWWYDTEAVLEGSDILDFQHTINGPAIFSESVGFAQGSISSDGTIQGQALFGELEVLGSWTTSETPTDYYVRATILSETDPENFALTGPVGSWVSASTSPAWEAQCLNSTGGAVTLGIQFSLSPDGSDPTPLDVARSITLTLIPF